MSHHGSVLADLLVDAGGVAWDHGGRTVMRHFGDAEAEYRAATQGAAVFDRSHRGRFRVFGRDPGRMLNGVLTGTLPEAPTEVLPGVVGGLGRYQAVLTPKGKMVTDLWAFLAGDPAGPGFLLDVPVAGVAALVEHLAKILPPRFATLEDVSGEIGAITLVGPEARTLLGRVAGAEVAGAPALPDAGALVGLEEGEWRAVGVPVQEGVLVARVGDVWPEAYSLIGPARELRSLWSALVDAGAAPSGYEVWSTLRVEAHRPEFGTDMTGDTIPVEAGIHPRAIDGTKGCYTGQEVIVRIRDRGHVNKNLRLLRLGDLAPIPPGTEFQGVGQDQGKTVGWVTSSVRSPREGETLALGYVRRGIETVSISGREVRPEEL